MSVFIAPVALWIERLLGYPGSLVQAIGHPVIWMGGLIGLLDRHLNTETRSAEARRGAGILALAALLLATLVPALLVQDLTRRLPQGWLLEALLATAFLAQKELGRAVRAVADALESAVDDGRAAVSHIVGRDTASLDAAGVSRAAIETLAENASDGVIAPLFWLFLFGLPGIALYKAINTADSMIGHLSPRYRAFGWASARLDDLVNLVPSRLTAGLLVLAAALTPGADPKRAAEAAFRDAPRHASPNAGWPEAALAGALGFALGGPRAYDGQIVELQRMGAGRSRLGPQDILLALRLYWTMLNVALAGSFGVAMLVFVV